MWYGKGPGVDRSGDALRHGNLAGSARYGGVLLLMGDDHACESSTTAHQSEYAMVDAMIPIVNPAGVQDIVDYGLWGWALSRFSGCWVGVKSVHDTVEASASVSVEPHRLKLTMPDDFLMPVSGLNIRRPDPFLDQERRLHEEKLAAVAAFARANPLDRRVLGQSGARVGIVTTGKSYLDVRRALMELGVDEKECERLGLSLYKVGMPWPLEVTGLKAFTAGLEELIVVEEKRGLIEGQIKAILYGSQTAPTVVGKRNEKGEALFPSTGRLEAAQIAQAIGQRLLGRGSDGALSQRVARLDELLATQDIEPAVMTRTPYFCAGCPHNSSTVVPKGSRALSGIGCHFMAQWMDRNTAGFTQMGGEGASWLGESRFSTTEHVFQNIGDGTYFHSGLLAIRACVAGGVNMTFKILYNDAVAMTGGQPMDGPLDPASISRQIRAEGVGQIVVVTDQPDKYPAATEWASGVTVHHRRELIAVQESLREVKGVTALIYDQTCAAEKRRRRRRGTMEDPARRLFINERVCEGCGDCSVKSNCVGVVPKATPLGRKREIDQSACNKDYSCLDGFCPSFVSVEGGSLRGGSANAVPTGLVGRPVVEPDRPVIDGNYSIVLTGVGGTGVVTVGAILGMAAHMARMGCSVLDMAGLAQKGGAVTSYIILAESPGDINATHVADGGAHLMVGCDVVTSAAAGTLRKLRRGTATVLNMHEMMTGDFVAQPDIAFPMDELVQTLQDCCGAENVYRVAATAIARVVFGDSIAANLFLLGYAYQLGCLPVPATAIESAIELNGRSAQMNCDAFRLGRQVAVRPELGDKLLGSQAVSESTVDPDTIDLNSVIEYRRAFLIDYQDARYADRYVGLVNKVRDKDRAFSGERKALTVAVAQAYFKLLARKDEYEVARLHADPRFHDKIAATFEGEYRLRFHLAPPFLAKKDPTTGLPMKREFGAWILVLFKWLAAARGLRDSVFDPFRFFSERRFDREMISEYEQLVDQLIEVVGDHNYADAVELAGLPLQVRGYGHVKQRSAKAIEARHADLMTRVQAPVVKARAAG
jgi:indolepyruvate ferredoxin oxidoreductase